jgi:hypothetical protein|tara:strand:+ start:482 stop:868 length:387 start_codon:yes stop_codon:yes gene_type:complete
VVAGAVVVKDVVVLVEEEQDTREERTDSVVHRVEHTVVMEILMVMNVEDQVMMPLEEAVVEAVGTLEIVEETQAVTVMEQQVEVEETIGQVLTMLMTQGLGVDLMATVETGVIGLVTGLDNIMVELVT